MDEEDLPEMLREAIQKARSRAQQDTFSDSDEEEESGVHSSADTTAT